MAIRITVGSSVPDEILQEPEEKHIPQISINLNVRKALNGNYMIMDHDDIDIVVSPEENKIILFPKDRTIDHDIVYDTQNRMFKYMIKKGVVDPQTVKGGNLYSTFEADYFGTDDEAINADHVVLFTIAKFIEEEKPHFKAAREKKKKELDFLFNPDDEYSTDLGDVPHEDEKGTLNPSGWPAGAAYRIYESTNIITEETGGKFKNFLRVYKVMQKQRIQEKWDNEKFMKRVRELAKSLFDKPKGCGSFRCVYKIDDDKILKVVHPYDSHIGRRHNAAEVNNLMITKYPDLFPKTYERAPDFSWIVVERVKTFDDDVQGETEYLSFFPEEFFRKSGKVTSFAIEGILKWIELAADFFEQGKRDEFTNYGKDSDEWATPYGIQKLEKDKAYLEKYKPNRLMERLVQYAVEFNAAPWDFRLQNCGINSNGDFVLLDASIFGSRDGTAAPRPLRA